MPFASHFGQDPMANFYCIQNMQKNLWVICFALNYSLSSVNSIGSNLWVLFRMSVNVFSSKRLYNSIIQNVFSVFLNLLIEFQKMIIGLRHYGKTIGCYYNDVFT